MAGTCSCFLLTGYDGGALAIPGIDNEGCRRWCVRIFFQARYCCCALSCRASQGSGALEGQDGEDGGGDEEKDAAKIADGVRDAASPGENIRSISSKSVIGTCLFFYFHSPLRRAGISPSLSCRAMVPCSEAANLRRMLLL